MFGTPKLVVWYVHHIELIKVPHEIRPLKNVGVKLVRMISVRLDFVVFGPQLKHLIRGLPVTLKYNGRKVWE